MPLKLTIIKHGRLTQDCDALPSAQTPMLVRVDAGVPHDALRRERSTRLSGGCGGCPAEPSCVAAASMLFCHLEKHAGMSTTSTTDLAENVIAILRAHREELRRAGIRHLSLFGSVARGDDDAGSDVDLAAEFDPAARMDLFRLTALERRIAEILGRRVDLLPEPVEKARLRANIDRDRRLAF